MSAELEQFCILAKTQKGRACSALVQQVSGNNFIFKRMNVFEYIFYFLGSKPQKDFCFWGLD